MSATSSLNAILFTLDPTKFPSLGAGLWGTVIDLGDGTVLKLARRSCAGIGDGREKIEREFQLLQFLEQSNSKESAPTPRALCWGDLPPESLAKKSGYDLFLQQSKLLGSPYAVKELLALSEESLDGIAHEVAYALVHLHKRLQGAQQTGKLSNYSEHFQSVEAEFTGDPFAKESISRISIMSKSLHPESLQPVHGDFNISNLLFSGTSLTGILDFAEAQLAFPEHDLAPLISEIPNIKEALIGYYERCSNTLIVPERLTLSLLANSLCSYLIARRAGDDDEAATVARAFLSNK